tara:strand:- start:3600 stop:3803 length:204 start_codon:yes stop_codon:yes gene_type:complete
MKVIFEWMSPQHKAKRILHNEKLKHNTKHGQILIHKNTIDILVYSKGGRTEHKTTIPNVEASYKAEW